MDNTEVNFKYNFQQRILNLKVILNIWKQRKLSLKCKIIVLNNLALAPIIYTSCVVNTSNKAICEINNLIHNFIWHGANLQHISENPNSKNRQGRSKLCHYETKVKAEKDYMENS